MKFINTLKIDCAPKVAVLLDFVESFSGEQLQEKAVKIVNERHEKAMEEYFFLDSPLWYDNDFIDEYNASWEPLRAWVLAVVNSAYFGYMSPELTEFYSLIPDEPLESSEDDVCSVRDQSFSDVFNKWVTI